MIQTVLLHKTPAANTLPFLLCLIRVSEHAISSPFQPFSTGTKGKLARKPSNLTRKICPSQVYGATRLFGTDLEAPRDVPSPEEEFVADLVAELNHDSLVGIIGAVGP
eukprot:3987751-Pleurochrysis_carterae.AAC.9